MLKYVCSGRLPPSVFQDTLRKPPGATRAHPLRAWACRPYLSGMCLESDRYSLV